MSSRFAGNRAKPDLPGGTDPAGDPPASEDQQSDTAPELDKHSGTVLGSRLRFVFVGDSGTEEGWTYPDLIDHISATEKFGFTGWVQGPVTGPEIRATMDGDLVYFNGPIPPAWWCRAEDHIVTLRR